MRSNLPFTTYMKAWKILFGLGMLLSIEDSMAACPGTTGSVAKLVCLADSLKASLTSSQVSTLQLPYSYTNSQTWSNLPVTMQARIGIKLGTLSAAQLGIAKALVQELSGTIANEGYDEVEQLLLADAFLAVNGGGTAYGSGQYYLCFNGTPTLTGLFSIKFGGHHLQIENTYNNGNMVGGTPHFKALEPLSFTSGGTTYTPMAQEKNALAAMFASLNTTELASARLTATFTDILMGAKNNGAYKDWIFPATKVGVKVGNLTAAQKNLVLDAIKTYVQDIDDAHATAILNQYTQELNDTYIAFSGNASLANQNDYARIDGPGVWIEFTVQGGIVMSGVHYHSIWRDHLRDYGGAGSSAGVQTSAVGISAPTAVVSPDNLSLLQAFPNPTNDWLNLRFSLSKPTDLQVLVLDMQGKVWINRAYPSMQAMDQSLTLDLNALSSGLYQVVLIADNRKQTIKVVKD